jgi:hypothetical protein
MLHFMDGIDPGSWHSANFQDNQVLVSGLQMAWNTKLGVRSLGPNCGYMGYVSRESWL